MRAFFFRYGYNSRMDVFYFIIRHTPFWSVPGFCISLEFAYLYWLKDRKKTTRSFLMIAFFCFISTCYYVYIGGPERSVNFLKEFYNNY